MAPKSHKSVIYKKISDESSHLENVFFIARMLIGAVVGNPFVQAMAESPEEKAAMVKVLELLTEGPY